MDVASDHVLAELMPGDLCGEMSLLDDSPARATVMTQSKCWVLALGRDEIDPVIRQNPEVGEVIRNLACNREIENVGRSRSGFEPDGAFEA